MKKLLTFFLTALLAFAVGWADEVTYTFNSVSWGASPENWSGSANANQYSATQNPIGVQVTTGKQGMTVTSPTSYNNISKIVVTYTSTSKGVGTIKVSVGNTEIETQSIAKSQSQKDLTYNVNNLSGKVSFVPTCTTNSYSINSITITYNTGGTQPAEPNWYRKVTDLSSDLVAGKKYIFITGTTGMGAINANGYGASVTGLEITNNRVNIGGTDVAEFTLGGSSDLWTFIGSDNKYIGTSSSSSTVFSTSTSNSGTGYKWKISSNGWIQNNLNNNYIRLYSNNFCFTTSGTVSTLYVQDLEDCATPTISPAAGTYTSAQNVTISCATSGATIYYTTDGTTPTTSSSVYSGPIAVTETTTIKAIAVASGYDNSEVAEATYTINIPASTIYEKISSIDDLDDGDYLIVYETGSVAFDGSRTQLDAASNTKSVTIRNDQIETSEQIFFTYNSTNNTLQSASGYYIGQTSDANGLASSTSTAYTNTISFTTDGDANIVGSGGAYLRYNKNSGDTRFRYYKSSSYTNQQAIQLYKKQGTPKVKTPTFSPDPSVTYTSAQQVTISTTTTGATIHYTVNNGEVQSALSPVTITVSSTSTIEAYATLTDYDDSDVATATYTIDLTPTLTASPASLSFGTIDGGTLEAIATNLSGDITTTVLNTGYNNINTDKWTVSPSTLTSAGGQMTVNYSGRLLKSDNTVRLSSNGVSDIDVPVHYQHTGPVYIVTSPDWDFTTGEAMTLENGVYTATINADADTYLVFTKKVGNDVGWNTNYVFGPYAEASNDNPNGDWWLSESSVGQDWPLDSTTHHTVKMHKGTYTITLNPATNMMRIVADVHAPVFSLASGRYTEAQQLTMTCNTEGAHIYYTTDGTDPATSDTRQEYNYNSAITVADPMTVRAVAVFGSVTSSETTATYNIEPLGGNDYVLTTSVSPDDEYVLVYSSNSANYAMGTFNSSNYYATTTSSNDFDLDGTIVYRKTSNVTVLTFESAGDGQYYIVDQDGYYLYFNSGNYVNRSASLDTENNAYKWTISVDENGVVSIQNVGDNTRYLRCNAQNSRYACYTSGQNDAKLYKRAITVPRLRVTPTTLNLGTIEAGGTNTSGTFTVKGYHLTDGLTLNWEGAGFSVEPTTLTAAQANAGATVTVYYSGMNATASTTVNVVSDNNEVEAQTVTVTAARTPLTVTITPGDGATFSGSGMNGTIASNVAGATIEYSFDGTTWTAYSDGFTASVGTIGGTVTVYARATYNGETATAQATYTRVAKSTTLFEKVTSTSQIKAGNKYIFVRDATTPYYALSGAGYAVGVTMDNNGNIDIASTSTTVFTLGGSANDGYNFYYVSDGENNYLTHSGKNTSYSTTANTLSINQDGNNGYYVKEGTYFFCYNAGSDPFRWYESMNGSYAYLYVQGGTIESPSIAPATGTYYDDQTVRITDANDGTTVYYTTDGSDPTSSATRHEYTGEFPAPYVAGGSTTIIAVAIDEEQNASDPASVTYTWGTPSVNIVPATGNVSTASVTVSITSTPAGATIYYTTDGTDPTTSSTQYSEPFTVDLPEVGDEVTVKAIAVYNGQTSTIDAATYTRVNKIITVNAPFFSPLAGTDGGYSGIYYGEQTLQIGCTTPNADIYYEIEELPGTTPPVSDNVATPTKSSTYYNGSYTMEVGKSYRVKAIAYIGNYASEVSEGYYTIDDPSNIDWPSASTSSYYVTSCKEFNELSSSNAGTEFIFANPVQVVYHSTYVNNGTSAEFCYVRDNTDYAVVYFGKADTKGYHIFNMGDWIAGASIEGELNVYQHNYHNQMGTSGHVINTTLWPTEAIGWSEIIPETTTCTEIAAGVPTAGQNKWGHYVHVRNTTMSGVHDEKGYQSSGDYDMKHTGFISDQSDSTLIYYDKFYLWSAGTCYYTVTGKTYTINCLGDYTQEFFDAKKAAGATFDVYGVVDWYGTNGVGTFQVCPIDFLWTYQPTINTSGQPIAGSSNTYAEAQTVTITTNEDDDEDWWAAQPVTIYYKTDDMEDWAEYTGPFVVSSNTTIQAYAEVYALKNDEAHTDYNDYVRSVTVCDTLNFEGIENPIITDHLDDPEADTFKNRVIEEGTITSVPVTVMTNTESSEGTVTIYTINGEDPRTADSADVFTISYENGNNVVTIEETTTIIAISYLEIKDNEGNVTTTLWSDPVTRTYTFVKSNGIVYDLVNTVTDNMVYVIVNKDAYMGLSTTQNATNRGSTGVKFTDGTKEHVYGNDELALFVLESANAGRYRFRNINGGGYLTVTTNDVANLNTEAVTSNPSAYTEAAVSFGTEAAGYPVTITFSYDGTNRYLRYFAKGRTFTTNADVTLNKDVFLYGTMTTPLAIIESEIPAAADQQVTVADNLIGAWAIDNGTQKYLWAKDMGLSIDKTAPVAGQKDYVKNILHYQNHDWDQSNWVILDFSNVVTENSEISPEDFVGKKLTSGTVMGNYVDDVNYRIVLSQAPDTIVGDKDSNLYPGYDISDVQAETPQNYNLGYNTYMTGNFWNANLNAPYGEGFVAGEDALGTHPGDKLFFMNPKVQEVARVWGVYLGTKDGKDVFTCLEPSLEHMANGWAITGAFAVEWDYNRLNPETYGRPNGLDQVVDEGCIFHAAIVAKNQGRSLRAGQLGEADDASDMSEKFIVYPLDFKSGDGNVTAVHELKSVKDIVSIRYYNIMGMESEKPFEGINIVVTRYSDGSASTLKIMR